MKRDSPAKHPNSGRIGESSRLLPVVLGLLRPETTPAGVDAIPPGAHHVVLLFGINEHVN